MEVGFFKSMQLRHEPCKPDNFLKYIIGLNTYMLRCYMLILNYTVSKIFMQIISLIS